VTESSPGRPTVLQGHLVTQPLSANSFRGCGQLKTVTFESGSKLTVSDAFAFGDCKAINPLSIPGSVARLGQQRFSRCKSPVNLTIESKSQLARVGDCAFRNCSALASISVPASVTILSPCHFGSCGSLGIVTFVPISAVNSIPGLAFLSCHTIRSICIPASVASLGRSCFQECDGLVDVSFECNSLLSCLGTWSFRSCSSLRAVCVPASVTILDAKCFYRCSSLQDVTFEDDSRRNEIGKRACAGCLSLTFSRIPTRAEFVKWSSFGNCPIEFLIARGLKLDRIDESVFANWNANGPCDLQILFSKIKHSRVKLTPPSARAGGWRIVNQSGCTMNCLKGTITACLRDPLGFSERSHTRQEPYPAFRSPVRFDDCEVPAAGRDNRDCAHSHRSSAPNSCAIEAASKMASIRRSRCKHTPANSGNGILARCAIVRILTVGDDACQTTFLSTHAR
jgi:hypothetical protein